MVEFIISIISGILTGFGMGGGAILIIGLTTFLKLEQKNAQGINLIFFIPTAIIASIINIKKRRIKVKDTFVIIAFGILGVLLGTCITNKIDTKILRKVFCFFILAITVYEFFENIKLSKMNKKKQKKT